MIKILFFARLREQLSTELLEIDSQEQLTTRDIINNLTQQHPDWANILTSDKILVAVNQQMTDWNQHVIDGDEVAFFPPVTGG